jgi:hypothetical protein
MRKLSYIVVLFAFVSCGPFDLSHKQCGPELACVNSDAAVMGWNITNALDSKGVKVQCDVHLCSIATCQPGYWVDITNKKCVPETCTLLNSVSYGVVSTVGVASVSGDVSTGCSVTACDPSRAFNATSGLCEIVLCTPDNTTGHGTISSTGVASVTGDYSIGCSISACSTGYEISPTSNSCIPTLCTLANAAGHTVTDITNVTAVTGDLVVGCQVSACSVGVPNIINCL